MVRYMSSLFAALCVVLITGKSVQAERLRIYIDADFSVASSVGDAIELGLRSVLAESDNVVAGHQVDVVPLDHRGNPRRSNANFEKFQRDPNGIAVFGGMQSPPYLTFGNQVNAAGLPLLLPWSAAAPVTRFAEGDENYIFRLSVDDSKVGPFLVRAAIESGCDRIGLVLVDTGWGRANLRTMTAALEATSNEPVATIIATTDIGPVGANNAVRDLARSGADCVISVLTVQPSIRVFSALHDLAPDIDVLSHWGMMSHEFVAEVPAAVRDQLNLRVVQTCGLSVELRGSPVLERALESARTYRPGLTELAELNAPAGFVHAYDLGLLFRAAVQQAAQTPEWSEGIVGRRRAFRVALENLAKPVTGILKTYETPFSAVSPSNPDGHDALGAESLCLVKYGSDDQLLAVRTSARRNERD